MRSRMASTRGPQRALATILVLVVLGSVFQYWRLRTVNSDLTEQLVRLEALLHTAEEKSSKIDSQRKEVGEDLKKVNANLQQLQITKDEEVTKCKHVMESLEEVEGKRAALQKELDDEKDNHDRELTDMAKKLKALRTQLSESEEASKTSQQRLTGAHQELERTRQQLASAQLASADATTCHNQLAQVQSQLLQCQSSAAGGGQPAPGQPAPGQPVAGQAGPVPVAGGSRGAWPGLQVPPGQAGQNLYQGAGLGGFNQAQGRAGLAPAPHRVIPAPPGAGAGAAVPSSSSQKPAAAQEMLAKPQSKEAADPGAEAVEGAGVLAPPQEQKAAAEPDLGLDDANLQYPDKAAKDALDDHPDTDQDPEAKDAALIKGLQELSNKSGKQEDLVGPGPAADPDAPEMVGAVAEPELTGGQQPPLPLR